MPQPTPNELVKECEICKQSCQPIPCSSNLIASEFYCRTCHKSYPMTVDAANYMLAVEGQARRGK